MALAVPNPLQKCFRRLGSPRTVEGAALLLQAYITSGKVWREHSQAAHTHVNPDVGLRGACGWLLSEEEQITGEELQLRLVCADRLDCLQTEKQKESAANKLS